MQEQISGWMGRSSGILETVFRDVLAATSSRENAPAAYAVFRPDHARTASHGVLRDSIQKRARLTFKSAEIGF